MGEELREQSGASGRVQPQIIIAQAEGAEHGVQRLVVVIAVLAHVQPRHMQAKHLGLGQHLLHFGLGNHIRFAVAQAIGQQMQRLAHIVARANAGHRPCLFPPQPGFNRVYVGII